MVAFRIDVTLDPVDASEDKPSTRVTPPAQTGGDVSVATATTTVEPACIRCGRGAAPPVGGKEPPSAGTNKPPSQPQSEALQEQDVIRSHIGAQLFNILCLERGGTGQDNCTCTFCTMPIREFWKEDGGQGLQRRRREY